MNDATMMLQCLHAGVVPATGCTEPIAVAYAAATAVSYLRESPIQTIEVKVSPNVMKNAMAVTVPGVGLPGLKVAAAAGAIAGDPTAGLGVIASLRNTQLPAIKAMLAAGKVSAGLAPVDDELYVEVTVTTSAQTARVQIAGEHTNIFRVELDGKRLVDRPRPAAHATSTLKTFLQQVTLEQVWQFATTAPLEQIAFMKQADTLNWALAEAGLAGTYGLRLGHALAQSGLADLQLAMVAHTAAASDARMGGAPLPAMSNSGSGNQGITATVPVSVVARRLAVSEAQLIRAQTLSHLTALYAHAFLPVLSAFCAADTAAMGAACGVTYLMGRDLEVAATAINNMVGDAPGMVCDGAGASCAMKVATSVSSMARALTLALQGIAIPASNGLVCDSVDATLRGLGRMVTSGMRQTDEAVLAVMMAKPKVPVTVARR